MKLQYLSDPEWWISSVVVGIALIILGHFLSKFIDKRLATRADRMGRLNSAKAAEDDQLVSELSSDEFARIRYSQRVTRVGLSVTNSLIALAMISITLGIIAILINLSKKPPVEPNLLPEYYGNIVMFGISLLAISTTLKIVRRSGEYQHDQWILGEVEKRTKMNRKHT